MGGLSTTEAARLDEVQRIELPARRLGIGVIGCGSVAREAHLPGYQRFGLSVVGACSRSHDKARALREEFGLGRTFADAADLLSCPDIDVVDITAWPADREPLIREAMAAGKHVLSQKPFALDMRTARALVAEADRAGVQLAVNQNGRFAPPWRVASEIIALGAIGDVLAVTHLFDRNFDFLPGTIYDSIPHQLIYDFAIHWIDISAQWLSPKEVVQVRAREYRTPNQPAEGLAPSGGWIEIAFEDGSNVMIRSVGGSVSPERHPFWVHGTKGVVRGSTLGLEWLELERDGQSIEIDLHGDWDTVGYAGAMAELLWGIDENREPSNSGRDNLRTLALTLAACRSADEGGRPVSWRDAWEGC